MLFLHMHMNMQLCGFGKHNYCLVGVCASALGIATLARGGIRTRHSASLLLEKCRVYKRVCMQGSRDGAYARGAKEVAGKKKDGEIKMWKLHGKLAEVGCSGTLKENADVS